jgi:hypothetical protein
VGRWIDRTTRLGRVEIVAAAIGVKAQPQAMLTEHLQQSAERRGRALLRREKSAAVIRSRPPLRVVAPVGLRPPCATTQCGTRGNQPAGDPLIEGETLSRPSRPPLTPVCLSRTSNKHGTSERLCGGPLPKRPQCPAPHVRLEPCKTQGSYIDPPERARVRTECYYNGGADDGGMGHGHDTALSDLYSGQPGGDTRRRSSATDSPA